jgi:hypothetical protein
LLLSSLLVLLLQKRRGGLRRIYFFHSRSVVFLPLILFPFPLHYIPAALIIKNVMELPFVEDWGWGVEDS